jgi:hypothetical protein
MTELFEPYVNRFQPISLEAMNQSAALLERQEHKYVIDTERFFSLIDELAEDFYILQIGDGRVFSYRSMYFDSDRLDGYRYHHQGKLKGRFKIRTRQYVESGLCFFEVKLKDKRGGTIKKRIPYETSNYDRLTKPAQEFIQKWHRQIYGKPFPLRLSSQIEVNYQRITLAAKQGGERMTIDFNLSFANGQRTTPVRQMLIVETKSSNGRGLADDLMRRHGIKPRSCSKYCLGANLLEFGVKYNRFKPLLKMYDALPLYDDMAQLDVDEETRDKSPEGFSELPVAALG